MQLLPDIWRHARHGLGPTPDTLRTQKENFLSVTLATLLVRDIEAAQALAARDLFDLSGVPSDWEIAVQRGIEGAGLGPDAVPDIQIKQPRRTIVVEAKFDAPFDEAQVTKYGTGVGGVKNVRVLLKAENRDSVPTKWTVITWEQVLGCLVRLQMDSSRAGPSLRREFIAVCALPDFNIRVENPLEVIRHSWIAAHGAIQSAAADVLSHAVAGLARRLPKETAGVGADRHLDYSVTLSKPVSKCTAIGLELFFDTESDRAVWDLWIQTSDSGLAASLCQRGWIDEENEGWYWVRLGHAGQPSQDLSLAGVETCEKARKLLGGISKLKQLHQVLRVPKTIASCGASVEQVEGALRVVGRAEHCLEPELQKWSKAVRRALDSDSWEEVKGRPRAYLRTKRTVKRLELRFQLVVPRDHPDENSSHAGRLCWRFVLSRSAMFTTTGQPPPFPSTLNGWVRVQPNELKKLVLELPVGRTSPMDEGFAGVIETMSELLT